MGMSRAGAQGRIPDVGPAPPGPVESFPRAEYRDQQGPRDFTAGLRLDEPQPVR